jgi:uncharacterized protein YciI
MFIVLLRFSANRQKAGPLMESHKAWLKRGFDDGVFALAGTLLPGTGGGIVAHGISRAELEARISDDPFVAEDVVRAEILELEPSKTDTRLDFLRGAA